MNAPTPALLSPPATATPKTPWPNLPLLTPAQAETRNRLARWRTLGVQRAILFDETLELEAATPLTCYPVTLHLRGADDDLRLGCDLAALFPEIARDVLPALSPLAAAERAEHDYANWMLAPWIDWLTQQLGQELRLAAIAHDQRWNYTHWAIQIRRPQTCGHSGTLGVTGSLLPRLAAALPLHAARYDHLAHIPFTLDWRVSAPALSQAQLQTLAPGAIILLQQQRAALCLPGRHGTIRINGNHDQGELLVTDAYLSSEDMLASPQIQSDLIPLDMLMASIDVVLDSVVMPLSEIAALAPGAALPLSQFESGRAVTLRCNGAAFARGEVVVIGERLGVLITHKAGVLHDLGTSQS